MRTLSTLAGALLAVAVLGAPGGALGAQSVPPITAAKSAATKAAGKANAHVETMQNTGTADRPGARRPAATPAATPAPARPDSAKPANRTVTRGGAAGETSVTKRGAASELTFQREVYAYPGTGRRDPFMSLMKSGDLRPLLSDLKLVTVLYDPTGRNSVAILRDLSTKDQYRVKVGQQLGRMRVAQIQPKQLVFTIEEFGFSRQETLALTDINTTRTP